jgi:SAM-dependent methyltransferase/uncharacterized protein YbaR (Trm112 family)
MLRALGARLRCPACRGRLGACAFRGTATRVLDGVLVCESCRQSYTIDEGMLELVSGPLVDRERRTRFAERWAAELTAASIRLNGGPPSDADVTAQLAQRRHFDWFADNQAQSYSEYQTSPFWVAEDRLTFERWRRRFAPPTWILDVGCANGRSAWPMLRSGATVVGCDISPKLVRQAISRAEADGTADRATFLVADCDRLPFADGSFDVAVTYGVLHHLPDPARACHEIQRVLGGDGVHLGSENNRTIFRALFDRLMQWRPLWIEEAGAEPLISEQMLRAWTRDLPVRIRCTTSVFLPPHLVNAAGPRLAGHLLSVSDRLALMVPPLRSQGGLLVFEIEKTTR